MAESILLSTYLSKLTNSPDVCWAIGDPMSALAALSPGSSCDPQLLGLCLVIPPEQEGGIFGFSEFVQASALLALVYTVSDVRYRFRIATAPFRIWFFTFWLSAVIGFGTLLTDVWFAQRYPLPAFFASQAHWQASFGILFLLLVFTWIWYAFVRPPEYGKRNPLKFTRALYSYLLQGAERDLPIIADELERSACSIVKHVREIPRRGHRDDDQATQKSKLNASDYASDLLLLIGNRKFCRHIVASAPATAIAFFESMSEQKKYRIPIGQFASNLSTEALINKDSLLYHEDEGYYSGYFGYARPFTNALYGNFRLVEALTEGTSPLDVDLDVRWKFDAGQLKAYTRAVLTTFGSALREDQFYNHSFALYRAFDVIRHACRDLYKLNEVPEPLNAEDIIERAQVVVRFIDKAIELLEEHGVEKTIRRWKGERHRRPKDYYDHIADLMLELIHQAAPVKTKEFINWTVQHNTIWTNFFSYEESKTRRIVLFKLRRLLYDEILSIEGIPNFQNASTLGFCLNVMGVSDRIKHDHTRGQFQLRKVTISWARRNYLWLAKRQPKAAAAVLVGGISFNAEKKQLVKTYGEGLRLVTPFDTLDLLEPTKPVEAMD